VKNQFSFQHYSFTPAFASSIFYFKFFQMNIYVSNLGFNVQDEDLKGLFTSYGPVSSAKVITDKFTNQSRGFGFVEMSDNTAAEKAVKELNGVMVDGRSIKVSEARPKENRSGGGGGYSSNRY
jgi:RNA recognition motif-containing protein